MGSEDGVFFASQNDHLLRNPCWASPLGTCKPVATTCFFFFFSQQWKQIIYCSAIATGEGLSISDFKMTVILGLGVGFISRANKKPNT